MVKLTDLHCEACEGGLPGLSVAEIDALLPEVPGWQVMKRGDVKRLERMFRFEDFVQAMEFTMAVGELAETERHHPTLLVEWGRVVVTWWTHSIGGLHQNDFIMAAKTDRLYG